MVACLLDERVHQETNQGGRNYWDVYLREICNQLGVNPQVLSLSDLEDPTSLLHVRSLILGSQTGSLLSLTARANLVRWVEEGGILIGFAVRGMDDLFGVSSLEPLQQPVDDYTISGCFELRLHEATREVHPFMHIEQRLLMLSDLLLFKLENGIELAHLYSRDGADLERPAITWRPVGKGFASLFCFDVAKTIWLLHQGRPLPEVPEGQTALRTPQMAVLEGHSTKIAYADEIVHLLQNMIARSHQPFIYQIPPMKGKVPEALLYYSGDEYTGPVEMSLMASDFMAERGLPYHINIATEYHPMTAEEFRHIQENGHEVSCYMWIRKEGGGSDLSQERFRVQSDLLFQRFGFRPGSVLIGSCQWRGWAEPARWLAEVGATADNTFVGTRFATGPLLNGPFFGFGFGTSYPFFFYEDCERGNERIDLVEQPIVCYELGHRASLVDENTGQREDETHKPEEVHEPVDRAIRYHLVMNIFYHPWYIFHCPHCRETIDEILRYIEYRNALVLHMGNNQVADWWKARSRSSVEEFVSLDGRLGFTSHCDYPAGMIVKVPVKDHVVAEVTAEAQNVPFEIRREFGNTWVYVVLPTGTQRVEVSFRQP